MSYAEADSEGSVHLLGLAPRQHSSKLRRHVTTVTSRWRLWFRLDRPCNQTRFSCANSGVLNLYAKRLVRVEVLKKDTNA